MNNSIFVAQAKSIQEGGERVSYSLLPCAYKGQPV